MEYYSDASLSGSESEEDVDEIEIYCPRELDYWEIEKLLDSRGPPPVIEYLANIGVVALREMVLARPIQIEKVVCPAVVGQSFGEISILMKILPFLRKIGMLLVNFV